MVLPSEFVGDAPVTSAIWPNRALTRAEWPLLATRAFAKRLHNYTVTTARYWNGRIDSGRSRMRSLLVLGVLLASIVGASAQNANSVAYSGHVLFHVRNGAGNMSKDQRLDVYNHRLVAVLGQLYLRPIDVQIRNAGTMREIWVGNHILATATPEDAMTNHSSVDQVARNWRNTIAHNISAVHEMPNQVFDTRNAWAIEIALRVWPGTALANPK